MDNCIFVGDVYFNENKTNKTFKLATEVKQLMVDCTYFCCNVEGPISSSKDEKNDKRGPNIQQDSNRVVKLLEAGVNLFDLANNHIMDYGTDALNHTIECLGEDRVFGAGVGTKAYEPKIICLDNKKIAIFGVGEGGFGVNKEKNGGGMHGLKIKDSFIQC